MTASVSQSCKVCGGGGHVWNDGKWARCQCIVARVRESRLAKAGVPRLLWNTPLQKLASVWPMRLPKVVQSPILVMVVGNQSSFRRQAAWSYPLRLAVVRNLSAASTNLQDLVDARFDRDAKLIARRDLRESWAYAVDLDMSHHKFIASELAEVWFVRSCTVGVTVFHSSVDVRSSAGRYGDEMARVFAKSKRLLKIGVDT